MSAILREEPPDLNDIGWQRPLALQRILVRCLEKNVERRFHSASDLAFAIGEGTRHTVRYSQESLVKSKTALG